MAQSQPIVTLKVELPCVLLYEKLDSVYVNIACINNTNDTIRISNPHYWIYSTLMIKHKDKFIPSSIKIHPVLNEGNDKLISLLPMSEYKVEYEYPLNYLFALLEKGKKYRLQIKYRGICFIWGEPEEILTIETDEIEFEVR